LGGKPVPQTEWTGNLLLDDLLGAEVFWAGERERDTVLDEVAEELRTGGAKPYVIPLGGSVPVGATGYVAAVEELVQQLTEREDRIDRIVFSSGSGGTHAGILVGAKALGLEARVEGIYNDKVGGLLDKIQTLAADTAQHLDLEMDFAEKDFCLHERYGESGYGVITDAEREAIRLIAQSEGIICDPIYTGRALAGLIDLIRRGVYQPGETVLFWHTGGSAGLFARSGEMGE
jgi:D-cysteine desulfhydrase